MTKRTRWELIILVCMYLGYTSFMVCRNTVIVASPEMIADPTLNLDEASYGRLMAYHSAGGVLGKLTTGFAVDRFGGRAIFLLMLGLTAATTAGFALLSRFSALAAFNLLGQGAKSGGWPAMAAIIRDWYPPDKHGRVWGVISTSSRVGVMTATLFLGHLLTLGVPWRTLFWVSAAIGLTMLTLGFVFLRSGPSDVGLDEVQQDDGAGGEKTAPHWLNGIPFSHALKLFVASPRVWLICGAMAFTTMMMDFLNFIPLYLSQSLKLESGVAGKAGTAFPAGMFLAVLAAGFLYDKLSKKQHVLAIGGLLGSGIVSIVALHGMQGWGLDSQQAYWFSLLAIFWFGVAVAPAYYLPMSVFSISYGGPFCGFLICLFDMFGYLGAFTFNYFGGSIIKQFGWGSFLLCLGGVTAVATVLLTSFLILDHRAASATNAEQGRGA
jgi:sugar phosphate permease